jgi:membrane-associated phospholipid phosphatase
MRPALRPLAALLLLAAAPRAAAEREPVEYRLAVDLPVTLGAGAFWIGTELAKDQLAPGTCRFCGTNAFDDWARHQLLWSDVEKASTASDVLAMAVLPAGVVAHALLAARAGGDPWSEGWVDVMVIAEAVTVAGSLGQVVKLAVGRQRPFVHYGNHEPGRAPEADDNLSFYSGHASLAFSLAVSAGTVSFMRGDPSAPWVLGGGLAAATAVGWLRVAGDKHYLTDVLAGAVAGSLCGFALPWFLHRGGGKADPAAARLAVTPVPLGVVVAF